MYSLRTSIRVYPHFQDTGGFFVAVLERKQKASQNEGYFFYKVVIRSVVLNFFFLKSGKESEKHLLPHLSRASQKRRRSNLIPTQLPAELSYQTLLALLRTNPSSTGSPRKRTMVASRNCRIRILTLRILL